MADLPKYEEPEWAGVPLYDFYFDVIKGGVTLPTLSLTQIGKSHVKMGRLNTCDMVIEHPSLSRLHAVIQFSKNADELFVFDNASSNGTFLNKVKISPKEFVPLKVGDQLKFGQSTRVYILMGPQRLMAAEGLNKRERAQLKYLEELEKRSKNKSAEEMGAALRSHKDEAFATWGIHDDIVEEGDTGEAEGITWQSYSGKMNERQEKQLNKLKAKMNKMDRIRTENQKIQVKEKTQGDLTDGQRETLLRNSKRLDTLDEEVELMEEALNESLRASFTARQGSQVESSAKGKKKRPRDGDIENDHSDEDDFFDRTEIFKKKREERQKKMKSTNRKVETIDGLWSKREELRKSVESCVNRIKEQEENMAVSEDKKDNGDALESFMSDLANDDERNRLVKIQTELKKLTAELASVESLYEMSDPDGLYDESKRNDMKRREKQKERESTLLKQRSQSIEIPETTRNSEESVNLTNEVSDIDLQGSLAPKARTVALKNTDKFDMPPPPPRVAPELLPPPRYQEPEMTSNDEQEASEDRAGEAKRLEKSDSGDGTVSTWSKFPSNQGELPPALPDNVITRRDEDGFMERKSILKAGLELRQKPTQNNPTATEIDSDAYARQLVDQILSAKEGISFGQGGSADASDTNDEYLTGTLKEWLPPQGQDGSGYTDINKKLGY